ncbi:mitotic checkpoint protein BUB3.2-like [Lactuca sativa]|uniref:mitotic checkpoint protein BUB3.2-like n=1 Tax=Lactuca sativa TaxID=4236 RepID=UPI0022AFF775|nr:mitotic checkpoint protein BUB3.2-like [Lactuca sativa]
MGFTRSVGFGIKDFLSVPARNFMKSLAKLVTGMTHGITSLLSNTARLGGMGEFLHGGAVLDCCFHDDTSVSSYIPFTSLRLVFYNEREDLLRRHDAPVRCIEYSYATGQVITGSWDKTLKCWGPRGGDIQVDDENIVPRPSVSYDDVP